MLVYTGQTHQRAPYAFLTTAALPGVDAPASNTSMPGQHTRKRTAAARRLRLHVVLPDRAGAILRRYTGHLHMRGLRNEANQKRLCPMRGLGGDMLLTAANATVQIIP